MISSTNRLPDHYAPALILDHDNDPKLSRKLMVAAVVSFIALLLLGNAYLPVYLLAYNDVGEPLSFATIGLKIGVMILVFIFYTVVHEKLRGLLMKRFSGVEPSLDFRGAAVFSSSNGYFSRRDFRIISLGPVLILAILIFIVTILLPMHWFWVGYIAQILNLAGSMKDFYAAWQGVKQPVDVLIQDKGRVQTFYTPSLEVRPRTGTPRPKGEVPAARQRQMKNIYGKKKKK